jgi:hypothetical protein
MLVEGTPAQLRQSLEGRVLELRGQPLSLLRRVAVADEAIEDAQMFGDRVHLRLRAAHSGEVEARILEHIRAAGGEVSRLRLVSPQLEDVFISLLE